ncbi:MAG: hypothetical protein HPY52_07320 [Firmicutes bacterium]|nr:hypothetical protein [Bacillota bacterium]
MKSRQEMETELGYFSEYVAHIASHPDVRTVTASEAYELYFDEARDRAFAVHEIIAFARNLGSMITYQRVGSAAISPAEAFYLVVSLLGEAIREYSAVSDPGTILEAIARFKVQVPTGIYGPIRRTASNLTSCDYAAFLAACKWAIDFIDMNGRIPDAVPIGGGSLNPVDFLATANALISNLFDGSSNKSGVSVPSSPGNINPMTGNLELERQVVGEGVWKWIIFPEGFDAPNIIELAKLQAWSLKPACLSHC